MSLVHTYLAVIAQGMDLVAEAPSLGEPAGTAARELVALHNVYFGKTSFSGKQRAAVDAARRTGKSLDALRIIEKHARMLKKVAEKWQLREELCALHADEARFDEVGKKKTYRPAKPPAEGVKVRRGQKNWTLLVTGSSEVIADIAGAMGETIESAKDCVFGEGSSPASRTTNVIITLDELTEVVHGRGDEVTLRMTNGAEITGARLVESLLSETGLATIVHPYEGPVNLYRTQRFASDKQRLMALAENPICAWPGCNKPGEECQIHHLDAWRLGGNTNPSNLATLCRYHNGVNEDDPSVPSKRGRVIRNLGRIVWRPPWSS